MNELSFDIKTSKDFFNKLQEDYKDYCIDNTSSRIALNCAMTAWHLTEWVYGEFNQQLVPLFRNLKQFQSEVKRQCRSLQIMHDLANGTKHYSLTQHRPIIKETTLHKGEFSNEFSKEFNTNSLDIELNDGTKIYFEDEIEKAIVFWNQYLQTTFSLTL